MASLQGLLRKNVAEFLTAPLRLGLTMGVGEESPTLICYSPCAHSRGTGEGELSGEPT